MWRGAPRRTRSHQAAPASDSMRRCDPQGNGGRSAGRRAPARRMPTAATVAGERSVSSATTSPGAPRAASARTTRSGCVELGISAVRPATRRHLRGATSQHRVETRQHGGVAVSTARRPLGAVCRPLPCRSRSSGRRGPPAVGRGLATTVRARPTASRRQHRRPSAGRGAPAAVRRSRRRGRRRSALPRATPARRLVQLAQPQGFGNRFIRHRHDRGHLPDQPATSQPRAGTVRRIGQPVPMRTSGSPSVGRAWTPSRQRDGRRISAARASQPWQTDQPKTRRAWFGEGRMHSSKPGWPGIGGI